MAMAGCTGAVGVGGLFYIVAGQMKAATMVLLLLSIVSYAVFAALQPLCDAGVLAVSRARTLTFVSGVAGGLFSNCSLSLFFEMVMETTFGWCDDAAASTVLVMINSAVQVVFLAIPTKIAGSAQWMNWLMLLALLVTVVPLSLTRVRYRRLEVDLRGSSAAGASASTAGKEDGGSGGGGRGDESVDDVAGCCDRFGW